MEFVGGRQYRKKEHPEPKEWDETHKEDEDHDGGEACGAKGMKERRYTWMDRDGQIASRRLTEYECRLEDDVQKLQDALFSISSHYAKIQFRLRQIASATGYERVCLLRDLERITCQGLDASQDNNELPSLFCDSQTFGDVRLRQRMIINQLRGRVSSLLDDVADSCYCAESEKDYNRRKYHQITYGQRAEAKQHDRNCCCIVCQERRNMQKGRGAFGAEKGYLREVWPPRESNDCDVVDDDNDDDDDDDDDSFSTKRQSKRKSKSKKKRHKKPGRKDKKADYRNPYRFAASASKSPLSTQDTSSRRSYKENERSQSKTKSMSSNRFPSAQCARNDCKFCVKCQERSTKTSRNTSRGQKMGRSRDGQPDDTQHSQPNDNLSHDSTSKSLCAERQCEGECFKSGNCVAIEFKNNLDETVDENIASKTVKKANRSNEDFDNSDNYNSSSNVGPRPNRNDKHSTRSSQPIKYVKKVISSYFQGACPKTYNPTLGTASLSPKGIVKPKELCRRACRALRQQDSTGNAVGRPKKLYHPDPPNRPTVNRRTEGLSKSQYRRPSQEDHSNTETETRVISPTVNEKSVRICRAECREPYQRDSSERPHATDKTVDEQDPSDTEVDTRVPCPMNNGEPCRLSCQGSCHQVPSIHPNTNRPCNPACQSPCHQNPKSCILNRPAKEVRPERKAQNKDPKTYIEEFDC
ncbi:hypothetical protein KR222_001061 [Zaprionus bogoriensis]|nr:hypothetical protein KR222_001061 [Zaprionus bogoriensis]